MKKILFLGYTPRKTTLINFLRKKNFVKVYGQKILSPEFAKKYDLIICFGYRNIIKKKVLDNVLRPPINLHISYLPYNRGAHPNFWSFIEKTPKGVSIHEINEDIDKGRLIFRKKINFKITEMLTFKNTFSKLIDEVEKLFKINADNIINNKYKFIKIRNKGSIHYLKDKPKNIKTWNMKIKKYLDNQVKSLK